MIDKEYGVERLVDFDKEEKRFVKKKKFFSLPVQIEELEEKVKKGEFEGTLYSHSDNPEPHDVYKLRLPNPDSNAGKSDGYRVYYMAVTQTRVVVFLVIHYKKEVPKLEDSYIKGLISGYFLGLQNESEGEEATGDLK